MSDQTMVIFIILFNYLFFRNHIYVEFKIILFVANLVVSYASAIVISLFFEMPLIGLEKFVFPREKRLAKAF